MSEPHDWLYVSYVAFTGLIAVVGIGTLWAVWRQGIFMKKQLAAFIEGQRPQISIVPYGNPGNDFIKNLRVQMELINVGQTTAYDCRYEFWMEVLPAPFADFTPSARYWQSENYFSLYSRHKPMIINLPIGRTVPYKEMEEIKNRSLLVCIRVKVYFRDAFSPSRYANFCFSIDHEGISFLPKYNDSN